MVLGPWSSVLGPRSFTWPAPGQACLATAQVAAAAVAAAASTAAAQRCLQAHGAEDPLGFMIEGPWSWLQVSSHSCVVCPKLNNNSI